MEHEKRYIKGLKKTHKNIYGINNKYFTMIYVGVFGLWLVCVMEMVIKNIPLALRIVIITVFLLLCLIYGYISKPSDLNHIKPYVRTNGFEFLGLFNLKGNNITNTKDVLSREEEARCMHQVVEEIIFPQTSIKQALCITGESGCGKSTIISFFKHNYSNDYDFYDFTGNYMTFESYLTELFGSNLDQALASKTHNRKIVFILDQFERYFYLDQKRKAEVKKCMEILCRKNSAIILSMRQEHLADFMKEFDMNNLKDENHGVSNNTQKGVLKTLVSVVKEKESSLTLHSRNGMKVTKCKGEKIIDNLQVHIEQVGESHSRTTLDPIGATLFYCKNQNEISVQKGGKTRNSTIVLSKLEKLFGEYGKRLYEKYQSAPLIKQQIIYHMLEFDKKVRRLSDDELVLKYSIEDYSLINEYFDTQLASCSDYYNATRIMYLLSSARLNHVSIKREDIEQGLFVNQFDKQGHEHLLETIDELETLQLIRKNTEDSDLEYEIAHDYIAAEFMNFSQSNMNRNTRSALDIYIAESLDTKMKKHLREKKRHARKALKDKYFFKITLMSIIGQIIIDLIYRIVIDPWQTVLYEFNPCKDMHPLYPLFINLISVIYLYHMYDKVAKYYRGEKWKRIRKIYFLEMVIAILGVACYPHYLAFDGGDLAIVGFNFAFLLNESNQQACRNELRVYGLRTALVGSAFAVVHILFFAFNRTFESHLIFLEGAVFSLLVGFAYTSHMTKEFLNGRRADAASEKIKIISLTHDENK